MTLMTLSTQLHFYAQESNCIHTSYKISENIFYYLLLFHNLIFEVLFNSQVLTLLKHCSFELCVIPNYIVSPSF